MRVLFLVIIFVISTVGANAQSATDQYHSAAGLYINGEMDAAERAAEAGLAIQPNDAKLQALLERIRQQQNQQEQGDQRRQDRDDEQQPDEQEDQGEPDPQNPEQQDQQQSNQDQPQDDSSAESDRQEEQQESGQQEEQEQSENQGNQQQPDKPQPGENDPSTADAQPVEPGQMTRAQAERILGALRADESALLRSIQRRPASPRRVERDW